MQLIKIKHDVIQDKGYNKAFVLLHDITRITGISHTDLRHQFDIYKYIV